MSLFRALIQNNGTTTIISKRPFSSSSPFTQIKQTKKSLHSFFQEAITSHSKPQKDPETETQITEIEAKLIDLEREIRKLDEEKRAESCSTNEIKESKKVKSLYGAFTGKESWKKEEIKREKSEALVMFEELNSDVQMFVSFLYDEGYFNGSNFVGRGYLDFDRFNDSYGRDFIKFAAEKFANDHQDIAKWLSGSALKKVALFGCPSLSRKDVFCAKMLRKYFEIQEENVCSKCVLKHSCKFMNQSIWKGDYKNLNLAAVMRIVILYALQAYPRELSVPDDIKDCVSKLLKEIQKLSTTAT